MYSYTVYTGYNNNALYICALYICALCCGAYSIFPNDSININNHRELNLKLLRISSHCCYHMQVNIMLPLILGILKLTTLILR